MKRCGYCELEDARLYYEITEGPPEQAVVLLHGGLGSIEEFGPLFGLISGAFHVVAVDMRGHGRSTLGTKPLTYQQHQADIQALITHLGLKEYALVGCSDGGIVAYRIAAGNPAVRALVTIGAQWRICAQDPSFGILAGVTPAAWAEMFPDAPGKYAALNPQGDFNRLVESCVSLWTDLGATGYPREAIAKIACPTLILRGDEDFLLSLTEAAEAQAMIPGASLGNIPFAGHAALDDRPDIVGRIVLEFLLKPEKIQAAA